MGKHTIVFVRHGQSQWNLENKFTGKENNTIHLGACQRDQTTNVFRRVQTCLDVTRRV